MQKFSLEFSVNSGQYEEGIINGNNCPLQLGGADISYIPSSKLMYLQGSEVHLSTFYTCWHLSCVCPQLGLWGRSSAKLIKNLAQLLHWSILSLRCSLLFPEGESFQCSHLISAALILLQHLMFHWVTDRGELKSSSGAAYCRLREFIDHHQHNISKRDLARRRAEEKCTLKRLLKKQTVRKKFWSLVYSFSW